MEEMKSGTKWLKGRVLCKCHCVLSEAGTCLTRHTVHLQGINYSTQRWVAVNIFGCLCDRCTSWIDIFYICLQYIYTSYIYVYAVYIIYRAWLCVCVREKHLLAKQDVKLCINHFLWFGVWCVFFSGWEVVFVCRVCCSHSPPKNVAVAVVSEWPPVVVTKALTVIHTRTKRNTQLQILNLLCITVGHWKPVLHFIVSSFYFLHSLIFTTANDVN